LGAVCARALASDHELILTYRHRPEPVQALVSAFGGRMEQLEARDPSSWASLLKTEPHIDRWVHCVGDFSIDAMEELDPLRFDELISSNLTTALIGYQACAKMLRVSGAGRIVFFGLAGAQQGKAEPRILPYYIAKQGLLTLTRSVAAQEAPHGLSCNMISVSFLAGTPMQVPAVLPSGRSIEHDELVHSLRTILDGGPQLTGSDLQLGGAWRLR